MGLAKQPRLPSDPVLPYYQKRNQENSYLYHIVFLRMGLFLSGGVGVGVGVDISRPEWESELESIEIRRLRSSVPVYTYGPCLLEGHAHTQPPLQKLPMLFKNTWQILIQ